MKIRNGFVSNSSSSSFLIIVKKGELNNDKLIKLFDVDKTSLIFPLVKKFADDLIYCSENMTTEEFLDNYSYGDNIEKKERNFKEDYEVLYEYYKKVIDNNWELYNGSADDYEYPTISEVGLDYEDDDIIIKTLD